MNLVKTISTVQTNNSLINEVMDLLIQLWIGYYLEFHNVEQAKELWNENEQTIRYCSFKRKLYIASW